MLICIEKKSQKCIVLTVFQVIFQTEIPPPALVPRAQHAVSGHSHVCTRRLSLQTTPGVRGEGWDVSDRYDFGSAAVSDIDSGYYGGDDDGGCGGICCGGGDNDV